MPHAAETRAHAPRPPSEPGGRSDPQPAAVPALSAPHFVVVVRNGPTHDLTDQLEYHAALLARIAPGLVLTNGPRAGALDVGRVRVECLDTGDRARGPVARLAHAARAVRRATRALRASRLPGLVVAYDPFASGVIATGVKLLGGAQFVCELNGAFGNLDNYADVHGDRERVRERMLRFGSWTLRHADGVRLLFDRQLDGFRFDRARVPVHRSFDPVPLARFADLGTEPTILFVGHPYRRKGVDVLLRAYARVRPAFPQWRLVLVGHELEPACRASGLPLEGVEIVRPTNNARLAPLLGRCGIFVLPSRSEAMGRVLLEAAAAGKARVGAAVDGIPTVIDHEADGLLFPKEDDAALAAALTRLMRSPELRERLGAAARARVAAEFSGEAWLRSFTALANDVIARGRGASDFRRRRDDPASRGGRA